MIITLLGMLVDGEACADSDKYVGYALDLGAAAPSFPGAADIWIVLSTSVAASYADSDETYEFQLHMGTGVDGSDDINDGVKIIESTTALAGNDTRLATAGEFIWRHTLDYECSSRALSADNRQYIQLYYAQTGSTNTISVDFTISPSKPRTDYNIQVEFSPVVLPT